MEESEFQKTPKSRARRLRERITYDKKAVFEVLDRARIAHVARCVVKDGSVFPICVPMIFGLDKERDLFYLHGSSGMGLVGGAEENACATVTLLEGLVLAKSSFHHSVNYSSVVLHGQLSLVEDKEEKMFALKLVTDKAAYPGRWDESRIPNEDELKKTSVLKLEIETATCKARSGPPKDDAEDIDANVYWSGIVPVASVFGAPISDEHSRSLEVPKGVLTLK